MYIEQQSYNLVSFKMAVRDYSKSMLSVFSNLFYISRIVGIIPFSISDFYYKKILKSSKIGTLQVLLCIVVYFFGYHLLMGEFNSPDGTDDRKQSTLTVVIGIFLNYLGPLMMGTDLLVNAINQKKVIALFDRFKVVDERLLKENILIDNTRLERRINILLAVIVIGEFIIASSKLFVLTDINYWLWYLSCVPTLINAIEKTWFASLLYALKQRFRAINVYLDQTVQSYTKKRKAKDLHLENIDWSLGYLHKEILLKNSTFKMANSSRKNKIISVVPWDDTMPVKAFSEEKDLDKSFALSKENDPSGVMKLEVKLNSLCQLHDEVCEISKTVNAMWSIQMLLLMAYGFMSITAQFYFLYCGLVEQDVPPLFKSAKNVYVSCLYIVYTAAKCVYIIYLSWETKLESRRTGVCLHKSAIAVDENNFYEIVNHLSLKLLNHSVNFSACGFFSLDMTTVYAVTGAITSYLVILIQFNLAGHQAKKSASNTTATSPFSDITSTTPFE